MYGAPMLFPLTSALVVFSAPCLTTYDCCVKNHPYDAVEACGYPQNSPAPPNSASSTPDPRTGGTNSTAAPRPPAQSTPTPSPSPPTTTATPAPSTPAPQATPSPAPGSGAMRWLGPAAATGAGAALKDSPTAQPNAPQAGKSTPEVEAAKRERPPKPPEVKIRDEHWKPASGETWDQPCIHAGSGGVGPFKGSGPGWIRCEYACGRYQVILYDVWGTSITECDKEVHRKRAKRESEIWARIHDRDFLRGVAR